MFVYENDAIWEQFFLSSIFSTPPLQLSRAMQRPYFRPFLFRPSCNNNNTQQQQQQQFNPNTCKRLFLFAFSFACDWHQHCLTERRAGGVRSEPWGSFFHCDK